MSAVPRSLRVGVVGATGVAGSEIVRVLEEREFPVAELRPFASERSRGRPIPFRGDTVSCQVLSSEALVGLDLVLMEAPPEIADAHTQLVNDAGFPQWRTIPFEDAARDALAVAETLDGLIERIDPQVAERLIAAGRGRLVDRSIHRNEHLDDLETDSDHRLGGMGGA